MAYPDQNVCVGLFGPCSNPPDPACALEDPDGVGPPVQRCRTCAEAGDAFLNKVFSSPKKAAVFEKLLEQAEVLAKSERS